MLSDSETQKKMGKVVAKAWSDSAYLAKLRANPSAVLAEEGIAVPHNVKVKLVEDTGDTAHVVLPHRAKQGTSSGPEPMACKIFC
jgi:hypothetical protein